MIRAFYLNKNWAWFQMVGQMLRFTTAFNFKIVRLSLPLTYVFHVRPWLDRC